MCYYYNNTFIQSWLGIFAPSLVATKQGKSVAKRVQADEMTGFCSYFVHKAVVKDNIGKIPRSPNMKSHMAVLDNFSQDFHIVIEHGGISLA